MKDSYYRIVDGWLASISMMPGPAWGPSTWVVCRVAVKPSIRHRGLASELLREVCADADNEQLTLVLNVEPDPSGLTYEELEAFYERYGFRWTDDHSWMERSPTRTSATGGRSLQG